MCGQCENCVHACFARGAERGVMDCDPDEYWCSADEDMYYYGDDKEIEKELYYDFIEEAMKNGMSKEEAENAAKEEDFSVDCPSFTPESGGRGEFIESYDYYRDIQ